MAPGAESDGYTLPGQIAADLTAGGVAILPYNKENLPVNFHNMELLCKYNLPCRYAAVLLRK